MKLPVAVAMIGVAGELILDTNEIIKNPIPVFEVEYGERVIASTMMPLEVYNRHPVSVRDKLLFEFVPFSGGIDNNFGYLTLHVATGATQEISPYSLDGDYLRLLDYAGIDLNEVDTIYLFNRTRDLDLSESR